MARDDERVRERLGALDGGRAVRGGRWDFDEFEESEGRHDEGPRTPQWLSEPTGGVSVWHERLVPERLRGTRWDPGRRGLIVLVAVGVAAVVLAAAAAQREQPAVHAVPPLSAGRSTAVTTSAGPTSEPPVEAVSTGAKSVESVPITPSPRPSELVVSVVGLVEHPGLLRLPPGARVADAVTVAIAREGADLASLNLAQRLGDGDQVVVGAHGPVSGPPQLGSAIIPAGQGSTAASRSTAATGQAKVNLNTATESDLDTLPGVGPTMARAILSWRTDHGRFTSLDQLAEVAGIGPTRAARLRPLVTL
ncbi:ComEA family DNA-binding protein [Nocardia sp. NPDC051570]|uniref:ComEA family DNA-binding protein n=1 Tax=Nocardia sp. NPDC051570 TaxID=3364324 RepID=UPI0037A3D989